MSLLLKFGGENYFIDFTNVEKLLTSGVGGFKGGMITETKTIKNLGPNGEKISDTITTKEIYRSREVDGFRYETIRNMIEMLYSTEETGELGLNNLPISFKIAFNTLIEYGILNIAE